MAPQPGDVLIRSAPARSEQSTFLVFDISTWKVVAGPYFRIEDAVSAAQQITAPLQRNIWQQAMDHRGRPFGPITRLDVMMIN